MPLIGYTIKITKEFAAQHSADIGLSTDSKNIKQVAESFDLFTDYTRNDDLASDSAGKLDTINDLVLYEEQNRNVKYDYILDLDVTSPLRSLSDLNSALHTLKSNTLALNIFSVNKAHETPYFNMVEQKENGFYNVVKPGTNFLSRQSAP